MCGRYYVELDDDSREEIRKIIDDVSGRFSVSHVAQGEVFPSDQIPVIYGHKTKKILSAARWGFPRFDQKGLIINARAETLTEKPLFRTAFAAGRCIVPAQAYAEWQQLADAGKVRYTIRPETGRLFYMAGVYSMFRNKEGEVYPAVAILTTTPSPEIAFIHNRMPVILEKPQLDLWLDTRITEGSGLSTLLGPYAGGMEFHVFPDFVPG